MSAVWSTDSRNSSVRAAANSASLLPLSSLVYQSEAIAPLSDPDLERLLASAQTRNRKEGVTGLLIYDQGRFLQWLEGPTEGVGRVWHSIRNDQRHKAVALLGQTTLPARAFGATPMALGKRRAHSFASSGAHPIARAPRPTVVDLPAELVDTLYQRPQAAPAVLAELAHHPVGALLAKCDAASLRAVLDSVIVPKLLARHAAPQMAPSLDPRAAELAQLLLAAEPRAAFALIDSLRADGRSLAQLCAGLLEPAARVLGDLWQTDDCSEVDVTLGLGHLQAALRRASLETSSADVPLLPSSVPHAVLVAPSPHETHMLGSVIASEMFWRAGWDVRCEFPASDTALNQLVHDQWFDVLDLSLSGAFTRSHRLPAMAESIRAAHAHSLNPALTVIVDGRVFHDQPGAGAEVGASSSASAQDLVTAAQPRHRP